MYWKIRELSAQTNMTRHLKCSRSLLKFFTRFITVSMLIEFILLAIRTCCLKETIYKTDRLVARTDFGFLQNRSPKLGLNIKQLIQISGTSSQHLNIADEEFRPGICKIAGPTFNSCVLRIALGLEMAICENGNQGSERGPG